MPVKTYKVTKTAKMQDIQRQWCTIDAENQILGRLASYVAKYLQGKHKPYYTTNIDTGDHIIVINADKVKVTGRKLIDKAYHYHTGHPGGLKSLQLQEQLTKNASAVIERAVKRMLPKGPLGLSMFKKLHVYRGADHAHQGQKPVVIHIGEK